MQRAPAAVHRGLHGGRQPEEVRRALRSLRIGRWENEGYIQVFRVAESCSKIWGDFLSIF